MAKKVTKKTDSGSTTTKKKTKKATRKRAKANKEVRLMAYWGVFDQSAKQVARFDYADRKQADLEATRLGEKKKSKFFVQPVKETIEIDLEETPPE